jgi:hypothetical protein
MIYEHSAMIQGHTKALQTVMHVFSVKMEKFSRTFVTLITDICP